MTPLHLKTNITLLALLSFGALVLVNVPDALSLIAGSRQSASLIDIVSDTANSSSSATTSTPENSPRAPSPLLIASAGGVFDPLASSFLFQKNIDAPMGIASLTKIMTALIAWERSPDDVMVPVSAEAMATEGSIGNLGVGEQFTMRDMLKIMLMESSNDAASAIAEYIGRKEGGENFAQATHIFVGLMNREAEIMGMRNTIFLNPIGLDTPDEHASNISTVRNLAKLVLRTLSYPKLWELTTLPHDSVTAYDGTRHTLINSNVLADETTGLVGGKTGFTDQAGGSLIVIEEIPLGKPKIAIVLGSTYGDRFDDMRRLIGWVKSHF